MRHLLASAVGAVLALSGARYADPAHRFHYTIPSGCTQVRHSAHPFDAVSCHDGTAGVVFAGGGTDQAALQRLVNTIIGDWTNLKLIANDRRTTLDRRPARSIFAVGIRPDHAVANIQITAVAKDGGWYALVFQSAGWASDAKSYFGPIADSFGFD